MSNDEHSAAKDICELISAGSLDSQLTYIVETVRLRREAIAAGKAASNRASLKPGARVRVSDSIRPKYIAGATAVVDRVMGDKVRIKLESAEVRFKAHRYVGSDGGVTCPLSCVEAMASADADDEARKFRAIGRE